LGASIAVVDVSTVPETLAVVVRIVLHQRLRLSQDA
jgi:hypothetical protein